MQRPTRPLPGKAKIDPQMLWRWGGGAVLILGLLVLMFSLLKRGGKDEVVNEAPADSVNKPAAQETQKAIPSKIVGTVPKVSSTPEELAQVEDEPATPEFIAEHTATLKKVLDTQIKGSELTLKVEKDPAKKAEIERRIAGARRFRQRLDAVNPRDKSTWFFDKDKSMLNPDGSVNPDSIK